MNRLRIVPLDDAVVFPGMPVTVSVDVGRDEQVLLVPRHDNTYASVGVVADVSERMRLAGRGLALDRPARQQNAAGSAKQEHRYDTHKSGLCDGATRKPRRSGGIAITVIPALVVRRR